MAAKTAGSPSETIERRLRAEAYVLGRMNTLERDQAQSDLETDARFREAVLHAAHRLGFTGMEGRKTRADAAWNDIARHLAALPHMSGSNTPTRTAERSPTVPLASQKPRTLAGLGGALRETWRTALALFRGPR